MLGLGIVIGGVIGIALTIVAMDVVSRLASAQPDEAVCLHCGKKIDTRHQDLNCPHAKKSA